MPTLNQLLKGERATVASLSGEPAIVQRLFEMGIFEGEEIEVVALAPLGDPIEIRCGDGRISLRRHEASGIQVLLLPNT